jgi:hypothetical protein
MRMSGVGVLYRDPGLGLPVHVCHGTRCCFKIINVSLVMDRNSKFLGILGYVIKRLPASRIGPPPPMGHHRRKYHTSQDASYWGLIAAKAGLGNLVYTQRRTL